MKLICNLILTLMLPLACVAQFTISGKIQNQADTRPIVDTSFLSRAVDSLQKTTGSDPAEKVYLHLDLPRYNQGDTIWFKAYTVTGSQHRLSALSGVLYVELIDHAGTVIMRKILHLTVGLAWGDIVLSGRINSGNYHLRAYTNWMRNAGPEYFYDQKLQIGGYERTLIAEKQTTLANPDVQFFPEGGNLVDGIRSKVAVKAVNESGLGAAVKGVIVDNEGNVVTDFATPHLGMGAFAFTPQNGKTYKARIIGTGEAAFTADLPKAKAEGFTLAVNNSRDDSIFLKVAVNGRLFKTKQNTSFYLIGQSDGKVYYTAAGKLENAVFTAGIEKSRFPSGIAQFTLFSESGEPLSERVAFIRNNDTLNFKADSLKNVYTTRQKVSMEFEVKNAEGKPVTGAFSVSVINESRSGADETAENSIMSNLLLTSELKGDIEKPNYYFTHADKQTNADLDMLMLTQGYRRFDWQQVLNGTTPPVMYQPEKLPELTGTVKTPGGKPVIHGKIWLMANKQGFIADTITDASGNFKFTGIDLPDTAKIILSASKENKSNNVIITVNPANYPPVKKYNEVVFNPLDTGDTLKKGPSKKLQGALIYNEKGRNFIEMRKLQGYPSVKDALAVLPDTLLKSFQENNRQSIIIDGMPFNFSSLYAYLPEEIKSMEISKNESGTPLLVVKTKRISGGDTTVLKMVTVKANKVYRKNEVTHSDNLNGAGNANQVIMSSELEGCPVLMDCLVGKVHGVIVQNGLLLNTRGMRHMVLIIDGLIMDSSHINDVDADNVSSIEVLRSGAYLATYGTNAPGGALVITTKNAGDVKHIDNGPMGLITYPFKGFSKVRSFYSPRYDKTKTSSPAPDLHSTIFWAPNIITDKDGKASFEYFNADTKGVYRIVIEGIDTEGNLGRQVYRYKVE